MTHPPDHTSARRGWTALVLAAAAFGVFVWLAGSPRRPPETVGFAELRPPAPAGHPAGVTVRLNLPGDFRTQPPRGHQDVEAGVANARGEPQFYVTVRFVRQMPAAGGETPLRAFAREQASVVRPERHDATAEFRPTPRGTVWVRRYTEVFQDADLARAGLRGRNGRIDRLTVLRYAEEWDGLILEMEFDLRPDGGKELESLVWDAVRTMELSTRR